MSFKKFLRGVVFEGHKKRSLFGDLLGNWEIGKLTDFASDSTLA